MEPGSGAGIIFHHFKNWGGGFEKGCLQVPGIHLSSLKIQTVTALRVPGITGKLCEAVRAFSKHPMEQS